MNDPQPKYFGRNYFKTNVPYWLLGVCVGVLITVFDSVLNARIVPLQEIITNLIFATIISFSITNAIYGFVCLRQSKKISATQFILIYYACNMLGMLVGIELSYLVVSFIYNFPYVFLSHFRDYRFNLLIVLVVSTVAYLYMSQKASQDAKLKEKELDLVKVKQLKTQAELQTLQSKINPHFLYNSLNSIASLIHEDAGKAEDMTLKLSRLFRYSINSPQENMASVTDEMEIVDTYLDIEKVRFGDRLKFVTQIDENVKNDLVPRFLIQPLVENALKHGLNDTIHKGELKINISRDGENILIVIADNGKPFPSELNMGYGLQSTYDKLALLYGENYQVKISNSPQKQLSILIPATV